MANANLEVTVKIDPSSVEVLALIRAANDLLYFREGIIAKEFDKFSPTLCGALHDLAMAVKAAEQKRAADSAKAARLARKNKSKSKKVAPAKSV